MIAFAHPFLAGVGVSSARVAALAAACGLTAAAAAPSVAAPTILLLGPEAAETKDENLWRSPFFAWIETLTAADAELAAVVRRAAGHDFFCSFGAASLSDLPLAGRVAGFIGRCRPDVGEERLQDMELALHEGVSNALVHGNLGVNSMRTFSMAALDEYSQSMSRGLADPGLAGRRVEVAGSFTDDGVLIDVIDEGAGYDASVIERRGVCGRGLELIAAISQKCEVCDGGRRLSMGFWL